VSFSHIHPPSASNTPAVLKRSVLKARLLTSDESLAMLEEKEKAKKDALLEKERRKAERIAKKQQREEEMKRKRARKAEEKAIEKALKQQEKAKKTSSTRGSGRRKPKEQTRDKNQPGSTAGSSSIITRLVTPVATELESDASVTCNVVTLGEVAVSESMNGSGQNEDDKSIDPDTCCMCFVRYEDDVLEGFGAEWINCRCDRWMHEDRVEETVMDSDGQQRFCTFCVDKYTV